jgi:hypothetical protein
MIGVNNPLLCATGHAIKVEKSFYCMNPSTTTTSSKNGMKEGENCFYKSYLDIENPESPSAASEPAVCGFNQNTLAYCNIHEGDKPWQAYLEKMRFVFNYDLKCNPKSTKCADFYKMGGKDFAAQERHAMYLIKPNGNANVADNDLCAKRQITNAYWGNDFASATAMVAGVAISLLYLI